MIRVVERRNGPVLATTCSWAGCGGGARLCGVVRVAARARFCRPCARRRVRKLLEMSFNRGRQRVAAGVAGCQSGGGAGSASAVERNRLNPQTGKRV